MTRDDINAFCASRLAATHVVQWGDADVWKVGGKVFAITGWNDGKDAVTFKVTRMIYDLMHDAKGYRPAPYMASRGMTWLQIHVPDVVPAGDIRQHIDVSHELVVAGLTRKARANLRPGKG